MYKIKHIILVLMNKYFLNFLPDKLFLQLKYFLIFNEKLDLNNPLTFNQKLQWLKLYDRQDIYTNMVDKYEAKENLSKIIDKKYFIPTIGIYNNFDEINFDKLPEKFVIKCTHDSGGLIICKDKKNLDKKNAKKKINKCLKKNYYLMHREWPYKNIKPRILIEKYMSDNNSEDLIDYKVMCFNGTPQYIFTCTERYSPEGLKVTFFDTQWKKQSFQRHYPSSSKKIKKPENLQLMLELSKKLSSNIPFVRVDWYEINGNLYFGELTFYPGAGNEEFTPKEWDYKLGELINLDSVNKYEK